MERNTSTTNKNRKRNPITSDASIFSGGKIPPQAVELEEAVLGALMLEKEVITKVVEILKPESFYKDTHRYIYEVILDLNINAQPVDILTVTSELRKRGNLEFVGGPYYVTSLTNKVASAANIEYHARIIAEKYLQRELIRISSEIQTDAYEDSSDAFDILDSAERKLFEVSQGNIKKDYRQIKSVVKDAIHEIEDLKNKDGGLTGIPSGFTKLDGLTSGFQKSDLVIIAARPGMGKTALALTLARNASLTADKPRAVAFFSLEMSSKQLVMRMISSEAEIDSEKLKKGNLEDHQWQQLNSRVAKLSDAPIFIDDTPAISVFELRAKCRRLKQQHDISMIVVDYLQLMRGDDANVKNGNREQEVSYISRSLKALAKEIDVPILALAQLSRASERRGTSFIPMLSDLRESGSIEQDADMVIFVHRPEYYQQTEWEDGTSTKNQAALILAKHRNGALDRVIVRFHAQYTKFADYIRGDIDPDTINSYAMPDDSNQGVITMSSKANDFEMDDDFSDNPEAPF